MQKCKSMSDEQVRLEECRLLCRWGEVQGCQLSLIESETHSFWSFLTLKTLFHLHAFLLISLILTDKLYHWPMGVSLSTCFQCWQPCEGLETDRSCTGRPGAGRPCIGLHCTVPGPVVEYTRTTLLIQ